MRLLMPQAVELDVEISRERVPLRNAYRHVGQRAVVRVNSGEEHTVQRATCYVPPALEICAASAEHGARLHGMPVAVPVWRRTTPSDVVNQLTCGRLCGAVATAPFPLSMQQDPLYFARGDLTAGEIKAVREPTSVTARLEVSSQRISFSCQAHIV